MLLSSRAQTLLGASGSRAVPSGPCVIRISQCGRRSRVAAAAVAEQLPAAAAISTSLDLNQRMREGDYEAPLVQEQASKRDVQQPSIAGSLPPLPAAGTLDVVVAGCGPAGLFLAAQMAQRGLRVGLVGPDAPFVNNYGVWVDEFESLGLRHTLERTFDDALCYFQEGRPVRVGRAYGRVSRRLLRQHLLDLARDAGVTYLPAAVEDVQTSDDGMTNVITCDNGQVLRSRLVTLASGQAAGRLLSYEDDAPSVAAQTAYGIEADVEGYEQAYDGRLMLFMDYRRHHTGLWGGGARSLEPGSHPNAGEGLWGSSEEVPSFLYAMPLGGNRVFLEETCLVAKPALPFKLLQRRLERRLAAMGVTVTKVHEEEWSFIPVGGPLPTGDQPLTAFGAAANLVHPATGFSVSRSLRQAPEMAEAAAAALARNRRVADTAAAVWGALWPQERRQQAAFHVFGMELLTQLDLAATNDFFATFFALPAFYWRGFLSSGLSTWQLLAFALLTFAYAPLSIKARLVGHLIKDPAGAYLLRRFIGQPQESSSSSSSPEAASAPASAAPASAGAPATSTSNSASTTSSSSDTAAPVAAVAAADPAAPAASR